MVILMKRFCQCSGCHPIAWHIDPAVAVLCHSWWSFFCVMCVSILLLMLSLCDTCWLSFLTCFDIVCVFDILFHLLVILCVIAFRAGISLIFRWLMHHTFPMLIVSYYLLRYPCWFQHNEPGQFSWFTSAHVSYTSDLYENWFLSTFSHFNKLFSRRGTSFHILPRQTIPITKVQPGHRIPSGPVTSAEASNIGPRVRGLGESLASVQRDTTASNHRCQHHYK